MQAENTAYHRRDIPSGVEGAGAMAEALALAVEKRRDRRTERVNETIERTADDQRPPVRLDDRDSEVLAIGRKASHVGVVGAGLVGEYLTIGVRALLRRRSAKGPRAREVEPAAFLGSQPDRKQHVGLRCERFRGFAAFRFQLEQYPGGLPAARYEDSSSKVLGDEERWAISPGYTVSMVSPQRWAPKLVPGMANRRGPGWAESSAWAAWRKAGHDSLSIIADPRITEGRKTWRLAGNSPALKLGFKPWDWSKCGPRPPGQRA